MISLTRCARCAAPTYFDELMDDRIEAARGIIGVLTRHLRARVQDVGQLHAQVQELAGA